MDKPTRRAPDNAKRDLILDAAARVLAQQGVRAFTHRAVAAEAGVPLGLTTYYFKDREELLASAIRKARAATEAEVAVTIRELIDQWGPAEGLARYIEDETTRRLDTLIMDYRLYMSALYQPDLQSEIATWHPGPLLANYVDEVAASYLGYLVEGYLIHAVVNSRSFSAAEVQPAFERVLTGN
ncbi:TetR family transcriptional regulator [Nonomuraea sp. NPDC026600]|uniref:TetR/AcrR family transcriptional regulator n=1 Tax=Nonomuraea sp. NPDC026600 TaxID=3155363 RepID=UPI0033F2DFB5